MGLPLAVGRLLRPYVDEESIMDANQKPLHPIHQIAATPTHKLLLKQWLKEEELILWRVALKETQIDSVRKEITHLYIFFFLFHSISLILLFNRSSSPASFSTSCRRLWIPSLCSFLYSLGLIWAFLHLLPPLVDPFPLLLPVLAGSDLGREVQDRAGSPLREAPGEGEE